MLEVQWEVAADSFLVCKDWLLLFVFVLVVADFVVVVYFLLWVLIALKYLFVWDGYIAAAAVAAHHGYYYYH